MTKIQEPRTKNNQLTIGWLYPDLMSTYGDRGNIFVIQKRARERRIDIEILPITTETNVQRLKSIDLIFGGGAQDRQQEIVMKDLHGQKGKVIKERIDKDVPALFVCGSPQLMGKYYEPARGQRIEGLGIFDMESKQPDDPNAPRLIGNIVGEIIWENLNLTTKDQRPRTFKFIVGFENHGGRTYLGKDAKPFAHVIVGHGNNGEDDTEGVVYKNAIGCYFHGPLLPKNPHIADLILQKALEVKYGEKIEFKPLDDSLEIQANHMIVQKLGIKI